MRVSKRVKWSVLGSAVILLLLIPAIRPEVIEVELVPVERGPLAVTIDEEGVTRLRRHARIAAPITGRLAAVELDPGDSVRQGQVVARIAPAPLDARLVQQAEAELAVARSRRTEAQARVRQAIVAFEEAQRDRERAQRLFAAGAIAEREFEAAGASERIRADEVQAAQAGATAAAESEQRVRMSLLGSEVGTAPRAAVVEVRSPLAGRVLRVLEEHERVIQAGSPVMEVGDPSEVEVMIDVLSGDATRVQVGAPVVIRLAEGMELRARVERVDPAAFTRVSPLGVEEQRVNVMARVPGPVTGMGDAFRVKASIVVWQADGVLTVPATSLVPADEGWAVYVVTNGRATLRPITAGRQGAREVEVVQGLSAGEVIVRHPDERLENGVRVRPPD
jgi:HlyD family secretion protein